MKKAPLFFTFCAAAGAAVESGIAKVGAVDFLFETEFDEVLDLVGDSVGIETQYRIGGGGLI